MRNGKADNGGTVLVSTDGATLTVRRCRVEGSEATGSGGFVYAKEVASVSIWIAATVFNATKAVS